MSDDHCVCLKPCYCPHGFCLSVSSDGFARTTTGDLVTATASASACSDISYEDAWLSAKELSKVYADIEAKNSANIIDQTLAIIQNNKDEFTGPAGAQGDQGAQGPAGATSNTELTLITSTDSNNAYFIDTSATSSTIYQKDCTVTTSNSKFLALNPYLVAANINQGISGQVTFTSLPNSNGDNILYIPLYNPRLQFPEKEIYSNGLGAYNVTTSTFETISNGGLNGNVYALESYLSRYIFVGGKFTFTADNSISLNNIARYDTVLKTWSSLGSGNGVNGLNGVSTNTVAGVTTTTYGNVTVYTLKIVNGILYVGGFFTQTIPVFGTIAEIQYKNIAQYNIATNTWVAFAGKYTPIGGAQSTYSQTGFNNVVYSIISNNAGTQLYIGGLFNSLQYYNVAAVASSWLTVSSDVRNIAFYNISSQVWTNMTQTISSNTYPLFLNSSVLALALDTTGNLYLGGIFTSYTVNGISTPINYIAVYNPSLATPLNPVGPTGQNGLNLFVYSLLYNSVENTLIVGGSFNATISTTSSNPTPLNLIGQYNIASTSWTSLKSFLTGNSPIVAGIFYVDGKLYVQGSFVNLLQPNNTVGPLVYTSDYIDLYNGSKYLYTLTNGNNDSLLVLVNKLGNATYVHSVPAFNS